MPMFGSGMGYASNTTGSGSGMTSFGSMPRSLQTSRKFRSISVMRASAVAVIVVRLSFSSETSLPLDQLAR